MGGGAGAILLVHAYSMYVYFYLLARAGLAKLDASLIEAAQALGAGRWDTLARVTLPLLRPALAGAGLLVFMAALGSFSAPYVFGGGFRVMTTQIVATKLNGELSLANSQRRFGEPERLRPLVNSLWMATLSTFAALALALAAGALIGRRRPREAGGRFRGAIETLVALPWALPGTVFAIALAATFSVSSPITLRWVLVGTVVLLPLAYLVRNLPVTGRAVLAGYRQLDPALEEAAASLGAGWWGVFRRVTLPLLRPALAAGASLAVVAALRGFVTSILLYTYDKRPISIQIMSSPRLSELGVAAAFGVILMVVSALVLGVGARR